jgi:hypothetical protein
MTMTAFALAADFAARVDEYGYLCLTRKQVEFLKSLTLREMARHGEDALAQTWKSHGTPMITVHLPDGREIEVVIRHNGSGQMRVR